LSELTPNAPDSYTVKSGDTLWRISGLFLTRPWHWPELWGMNLEQIRNPHLIYPGQILYLDKSDGRARLRVGSAVGGGPVKLSPEVRSSQIASAAISSIPFHLIDPFLNEAVIFDGDFLKDAPRIVATQEGRVMLSRGETAYVLGVNSPNTVFRIFRNAKPLKDPTTRELLGYEAAYVGTGELTQKGGTQSSPKGKQEVIPDTFIVTSVRLEAMVGDRLAPVKARDFQNYVPHAPQSDVSGQIVSMYGDAITGGQNQIVVLNRGSGDGLERGHVLALWHDGRVAVDPTDERKTVMKLPDERHGELFVFQVFSRMSYALIMSVREPVNVGDRFSQP
jgi:LysM repeat protein